MRAWWFRLDVLRLLLLALIAVVVHQALVATSVPASRPPWLVALAVVAALVASALVPSLHRGPRSLPPRVVVFLLAFVLAFTLAADMALLAGPRETLTGYSEETPHNTLGLGWLEDWHYALAPRPRSADSLSIVEIDSDDLNRERLRLAFAQLLFAARRHEARGVALDFFLEGSSRVDPLLRRRLLEAKAANLPVVLGERLIEAPDGTMRRGLLEPEIAAAASHIGHLQGYREGDGLIRLIPTGLPSAEHRAALSLTVAGLLEPDFRPPSAKRLVRFLPPSDPIETLDFEALGDGSVLRDRFVLVGTSSPSDRVETPFGAAQGVRVHAWATQGLATGTTLVDLDPSFHLPLVFGLCYALTLLYARGARGRAILLAAATLSLATFGIAVLLLRLGRLWLEVTYPLLALWTLAALLLLAQRTRQRHDRAGSVQPLRATPAPEDSPKPFDVLVSHNTENKDVVETLCTALRARGLTPWVDVEQLVPGRPWQEAIEAVLRTIPAVTVLVGAEGLGPWERVEMRSALSEAVRRGLPVIPVLLPGAVQDTLPLFLTQYAWVDLRGGMTENALDRLEWGITGQQPTVAPTTL